jgi:hypothetical protein
VLSEIDNCVGAEIAGGVLAPVPAQEASVKMPYDGPKRTTLLAGSIIITLCCSSVADDADTTEGLITGAPDGQLRRLKAGAAGTCPEMQSETALSL